MIATNTEIDLDVFRRYSGLSLPRHVSYPMPTGWVEMDGEQAASMLADSGRRPGTIHTFPQSAIRNPQSAILHTLGLSLYLHIPFCEALCKFCACTRVILKKSAEGAGDRVEAYLAAVESEIGRLARMVGTGRVLRQIHWGGGSPTYLSEEMIERLHRKVREAFTIAEDAEIAMEIDPRTVSPKKLRALRRLGFNRVSLGVQDFNQQVQEHVRRIQPFEMVRDVVAICRQLSFDSVNFDLIYGLSYQTPETVRDCVERTIELSPDRVAYYHYAQIPEKIATQRGMDYTKLPDSETKLDMFLLGVELFTAAGYDFIGLDHFAKSEEGLARAVEDGTVQRNFQGMTTGGGLDLIGAGASSISHLADIGFLQNVRETDEYVERINSSDAGVGRYSSGLPVVRGKRLTEDDRIRQALISDLYCTGCIQPQRIEGRFGIDFAGYFARELKIMAELERDGLVALDCAREGGAIRATMPLGRVLLRTVAAVFDAYLDPDAWRVGDQHCFSANA